MNESTDRSLGARRGLGRNRAVVVVLLGLLAIWATSVSGLSCCGVEDSPRVIDVKAAPTDPPEREPVLKPGQLMKGLVLPHFESMSGLLRYGPLLAVEWERLETSAALLHEASYILVKQNPDDEAWRHAASGMLRSGSASILEAVQQRDMKKAKASFAKMQTACRTCHEECTADFRAIGYVPRPSRLIADR